MRRVSLELLAPAKVNLALQVVGRRPDGYHCLDSIVVFAGLGDRISLRPAEATALKVSGPFAPAVPTGDENLVLRAARLADARFDITLEKFLPVGAGIGGGSSDAAAVLRAAARMGATAPDPLELGADVPVCVEARPSRMRGIGERLDPLPPLPAMAVVLVHPGVALSTPKVFAELAQRDGAPMPDRIPQWGSAAEAAAWLKLQRNDLEPAAIRQAPVIAEVRDMLEATDGCLLARMSGSGSSVFGLYASMEVAEDAAASVAGERPRWWVRAAPVLRSAPQIQERRLTT